MRGSTRFGPLGVEHLFYEALPVAPYGPDLVVYNALRRRVTPLPSQAAALAYQASAPRARCPSGAVGHGAEPFSS
jgi:hypothetical protein